MHPHPNRYSRRGSEIDVIQHYGGEVLLYGVEVRGGNISFSAWNEIKKIQKLFLH